MRAFWIGLVVLSWGGLQGQQTPVRAPGVGEAERRPEVTAVGPGVWRAEGRDAWSGVRWVRVYVVQGEPAAEPAFDRPTLTGQCTQDGKGVLRFEMFANFGGVTDAGFYPPWHSTGQSDLFPPSTRKVMVTMEFLGYTKVKPYKGQFEEVPAPGGGQMRYLNPGAGTSNMEAPGWFFQYLRALPTLRLRAEGKVAEFGTAGWMAALRKEAVCGGSGA